MNIKVVFPRSQAGAWEREKNSGESKLQECKENGVNEFLKMANRYCNRMDNIFS